MKIAVIGLWHLGCVTAAALAEVHNDILAYDPNSETIRELQQGRAPIYEPGLNELIKDGIQQSHLTFTDNPELLADRDLIWITFDTPVDDHDIADVALVTQEIQKILPFVPKHALLLISSQLPVGTTRALQKHYAALNLPNPITFAYSPENLRLGKAIQAFKQPERVVIGLEREEDKIRLERLFHPFSSHILWMSIESAEMTKHALNAFLATSVTFINELAALCEKVGANAKEVEQGLKSEARIGPKAYLRPGNAIAGGTLARDVNYLIEIGQKTHLETPLFSALLVSNEAHKQWSCRRILEFFKDLKERRIAALGLTYKAGTDTLRRSSAIETCQWLKNQGATVLGYDPALNSLPADLSQVIDLQLTLEDALRNAEAIVISTEWPEFINIKVEDLLALNTSPTIFDASGFLAHLSRDKRIRYFSVGKLA